MPGLAITLAVSLLVGGVVGLLISVKPCNPLDYSQLFDDELFWELAEDDNPGYDLNDKRIKRKRSRAGSRKYDQADFLNIDNNNIQLPIPEAHYVP